MNRTQRWVSTLIIGCLIPAVIAVAPQLAHAQEEDATPAASAEQPEQIEQMSFEELIEVAKTAYQEEDYDKAVKYLIAANLKEPNARLLLNVAKSYEKANDCVRALVYYRAFVRHPDAEKSLLKTVKDEIGKADKCEGFSELMAGRVLVQSTPSGAQVLVDGEVQGTTPVELAGLMEGVHTMTLRREGYQESSRQVDLAPDVDAKFDFELSEEVVEEVAEVEEVTEPVEPEPEPDEDGPPVVQYAIAGGVGAAGVALITIGLITDLSIPDKYDAPRQREGVTEEEFDRLTVERKGASTRALIFYITGTALLAGGVGYGTFVAMTSGQKEESNPLLGGRVGEIRFGFAPEFGRDGLGLSLSGEF